MTNPVIYDTWYHGTRETLPQNLKNLNPLYLTPSKALAKVHGKVYSFSIKPTAKWFDISKAEFFTPSMDSFGYAEGWAEKIKTKGYDIIWDSEDFKRGYKQIYVVDPTVLTLINVAEGNSNLENLLLFLEDVNHKC